MKRLTLALALSGALFAGLATTMQACVETTPIENDDPVDCATKEHVVDKELLAFLSKAKALHIKADIAEEEGDVPAAVDALDELVDGPRPPSPVGQLAPEAREVLADTLARSAELRSSIGQFERAKADIERGLELAPERTHYRGRLMEVLGQVEKRFYLKLKEDGNTVAAAAARQRALDASEEAVNIQDEVIKKTLEDEPELDPR
jgi:tetratricopeptide (TPR) repeat protein